VESDGQSHNYGDEVSLGMSFTAFTERCPLRDVLYDVTLIKSLSRSSVTALPYE
jgi:hypothetical protein